MLSYARLCHNAITGSALAKSERSITYKGYIMSQFKLATTTRSAIAEAVSSELTNERKWLKVSDSLTADGVRLSMIVTENKGGNPEVRDALRDAIVLGFSKTEQALYNQDSKALSDADKVTKRYVQQKVGVMLSRIEKYLAKAEAKASGDVVKTATTVWSRAQDALTKLLDTVQKAEGVTDLHVADAIRTIKTLKGYLPKV